MRARLNGGTSDQLKAEADELRQQFLEQTADHDIERRTAQYLGRTFVREADGVWRDEYGAVLKITQSNDTGPLISITEPAALWQTQTLQHWAQRDPGPPEWFLDQWIPRGQCTGLYGKPGVRKSLLILQLILTGALGGAFAGIPIERCPTLALFAEDEEREVVRRATTILQSFDPTLDLDDHRLADCHWQSLVGAPLTEFVSFTARGTPLLSPAWLTFREQVLDLRVGFAALDTIADFFGGNEVLRRHVHSFVRILDSLAQEAQCAILFAAHPSLAGIRSGSLASGSTAWEGKVRSRLTLEQPGTTDDQPQPDTNERLLKRVKTNKAAPFPDPSAVLELVVQNHTFINKSLVPGNHPRTGAPWIAAAKSEFLRRLQIRLDQGLSLSPSKTIRPSLYAPLVLAAAEYGTNFSASELETGMKAAFADKSLRFDSSNRKRGTDKWILNPNPP